MTQPPFESSIEAPTGIAGPSFGTMARSRSCMSRTWPSRFEVGDFLVRDAHGPQHAQLLRLMGRWWVTATGAGSRSDSDPILSTNLNSRLRPHGVTNEAFAFSPSTGVGRDSVGLFR
jgi:hypothetical protein